MTHETMTIHEALIELKTIDKRIEKEIMSAPFVYANKRVNEKINGEPVAKVCKDIEDQFKKVNDLIRRRAAIKRAVVNSNAVTKVVICGVEYTVAEAIEMNNNGIKHQKMLRDRMTQCLMSAKMMADRANGEELERRTNDYLKTIFGGDASKTNSEEIEKVRKEFVNAQTVVLIDPIDAKSEIEKLDDMINEFTVKVDSALSVSNATTTIEFEY